MWQLPRAPRLEQQNVYIFTFLSLFWLSHIVSRQRPFNQNSVAIFFVEKFLPIFLKMQIYQTKTLKTQQAYFAAIGSASLIF